MAESAGKRHAVSEDPVEGDTGPPHKQRRRRRTHMQEICDKLIAASTEVLAEMGPGHSEAVYEKAMAVEIQSAKIGLVTQQLPVTYTYKDHPVGSGRMDLLVTHPDLDTKQIVVELKLEGSSGVRTINDAINQIRAYLRYLPPDSRGVVIVFPKPGRHSCMCVTVAPDTAPPYITPSTLSQTYARI